MRGSGVPGRDTTEAAAEFPALRAAAVVPFAVCTAVGFLLLLVPPYQRSAAEYVASGLLLVVVLVAAVVLPWERWPGWTHAIPPLSFFLVIAVMLDLSGGSSSVLTPIVTVPVLWLALFGSRWALHAAAVATGLLFLVPLVLIGGADYPASGWRRAVMWMAVVWIVVPFVQAAVRRLAARERELVDLNADLEAADRQWQLFASQLPDSVVLIVDADLRYELIAGAGTLRERMDGWVGSTLFETSSAENIALLEPLYRGALAGERGEVELFATANGLLHEVTAVPFVHHGRTSAMVVAWDVSAAQNRELEIRHVQQQLEHLASHDPLTGLVNRRRFDLALDQHLAACARSGSQGAVLMLDLDQFKEVNDTFGHGVGDQLIVSVGGLLRAMLPESTTVARLGGDEFAVLLPRGARAEAEQVAQLIVEGVRGRTAPAEQSFARALTVSVGVVMISEATTSAADLLVAADMTMYDAKDAGRDRYEIFDARDSASPHTAARISWATRIRQALRDDRFVLHAQPVVDLRTGQVAGAELLLRMLDDDDSLIQPARFLHVAERMGLAPAVDRWVTGRAVGMLQETTAIGRPVRLSVNVSAHSLNDLDFIDDIEDLVRAAGVDPQQLVFEITETAAIANMERARMFADRLHALGCRLALDDFGAGHASFYYLKHLPFDFIKIDGEFVRSCTTDTFDRLVIASVVAFSAGTGRQVVAEYVGDEATALALREMQVDFGQGFHLGKPVPWQDFLRDNDIVGP
ncbi:MAG: EAL domain-containing protein [Nakamurella sp.]